MNIFFVFNDEVVTPKLSGSILPGITRKSVIQLVGEMGKNMVERAISIDEIYERSQKGELLEIFRTRTEAVISPVGKHSWNGEEIELNNGKTGELTMSLYEKLTGIQTGKVADENGWSVVVTE
jgi:branched-chain amino acid aminotransferase